MEIVIVSVVSGVFSLICILLLNHNWFKRQDLKYGHEESMYKLRKSYTKPKIATAANTPLEAAGGKISNIAGLLNIAKGLDSDQIGALLDIVQGQSPEAAEGTGDLLTNILENNPELVQSFLKGLSGGKKEDSEEKNFPQQ